jgi:hypothetical protein
MERACDGADKERENSVVDYAVVDSTARDA